MSRQIEDPKFLPTITLNVHGALERPLKASPQRVYYEFTQ